jgi:hypothetical protein
MRGSIPEPLNSEVFYNADWRKHQQSHQCDPKIRSHPSPSTFSMRCSRIEEEGGGDPAEDEKQQADRHQSKEFFGIT